MKTLMKLMSMQAMMTTTKVTTWMDMQGMMITNTKVMIWTSMQDTPTSPLPKLPVLALGLGGLVLLRPIRADRLTKET